MVVPEGTLRLLILAWGPLAAVFASGAGLWLLAYHLTRPRHAEIARQLAAKRAADRAAGRTT
jgi:Na+/melibiose symporter-like transporter